MNISKVTPAYLLKIKNLTFEKNIINSTNGINLNNVIFYNLLYSNKTFNIVHSTHRAKKSTTWIKHHMSITVSKISSLFNCLNKRISVLHLVSGLIECFRPNCSSLIRALVCGLCHKFFIFYDDIAKLQIVSVPYE